MCRFGEGYRANYLFGGSHTSGLLQLVERSEFDFNIVNVPFLNGDVPHRPSNGAYISQLIRFADTPDSSDQFRKIIIRYKRIDYNLISDSLHA